jgi:hypothetical protein
MQIGIVNDGQNGHCGEDHSQPSACRLDGGAPKIFRGERSSFKTCSGYY